jgi:hypothetical protein
VAILTGGTYYPLNFDLMRAEGLLLYDFAYTSPTLVTYFDDAYNYTQFRGTGGNRA